MPGAEAGQALALVFTDIEGSSQLWEEFGERAVGAMEAHNAIIRSACEEHGGRVVKEEGDAFFLALPEAEEALSFAVQAQDALQDYDWPQHGPDDLRVRIGLHYGEAWRRGDDLWGTEVNRAARICEAGHGGQVLMSEAFVQACSDPGQMVVVTDLSRRRLRGLAEPEHLFQATLRHWTRQEWPALRSLDDVPTNLPAQITSFVGRERELERLTGMLADAETRLITLTGPGGSGKSRLAQHASGQALEHFPDGVHWVELGDLTASEAVLAAVIQVLRLEPVAARTPVDQIAEFARERSFLLVLDNFEHVIDAADDLVALLRAAPTVKALVTSREVLRVPGEHVVEVPPLAIPEPPISWETLSQYESVHLFLHRAREAAGEFAITPDNAAAVAEICARLDGIPLALELAAAWVRMYTPRQILDQLGGEARVLTSRVRGIAERQRTLRGAIQWSYDLLNEEGRRVFRFLSVFRGGFFLDAAATVCGPGAVDSVAYLCDCSLLHSREILRQRRFYMLETIREFGQERLDDCGDAPEAGHAHIEYCAALARELQKPRDDVEIAQASRSRARVELRNFLRALEGAIAEALGDEIELLCLTLQGRAFHHPAAAAQMRHDVARLWLSAYQTATGRWTCHLGHLAVHAHLHARDHAAALHLAEEAMEVAISIGVQECCWSIAMDAQSAAMYGRREEAARRWLQVAAPYATDLQAKAHLAMCCSMLGLHDEAIASAAALRDFLSAEMPASERFCVAHAVALTHLRAGRLQKAEGAAEEALDLLRGPLKADRHAALSQSFYVPIFSRTGCRHAARAVIRDMTSVFADEPRSLVAERMNSLITFSNWGQMWEVAADLADEYMTPYPPDALSEVLVPDTASKIAESYARVGRVGEARDRIALMLAADWPWDEQMTYFVGQNLKSLAEVLRVTDNRPEAVAVAELARRLQETQPFFQLLCQELLDLLAEEMSEDEYATAVAAAEGMKPSDAIALGREVLGV